MRKYIAPKDHVIKVCFAIFPKRIGDYRIWLEYYYKTYDYRCMAQYSGYYPHYFLNKDSVEKYVQNKINAKRGIPNEE